MVRDFSNYALQLYPKPSSTEEQTALCMAMIRKPDVDQARYEKVWNDVYTLRYTYEMNP